jgi:hypothetical protein
MEQSPTGTATGDAAAKPTWLVRRMRMLQLRRARGHAPLRRGEPIPRQPGRSLVFAVNRVVVPSRYTHSRPKARTHGSTALARLLGTVACAGNRATAPLAQSADSPSAVSAARLLRRGAKARSLGALTRTARNGHGLPHPIALVGSASAARGRTRSWRTYLPHCHARRIACLCSERPLAPRRHRRLLLCLPLWPPRHWP